MSPQVAQSAVGQNMSPQVARSGHHRQSFSIVCRIELSAIRQSTTKSLLPACAGNDDFEGLILVYRALRYLRLILVNRALRYLRLIKKLVRFDAHELSDDVPENQKSWRPAQIASLCSSCCITLRHRFQPEVHMHPIVSQRSASLIALLVIGACASTVVGAKEFSGISTKASYECKNGEDVTVEGTSQTIRLSGVCGALVVEGVNAMVSVEQVESIHLEGMKNTVTYGSNRSGQKPKISIEGVSCTANPDAKLLRAKVTTAEQVVAVSPTAPARAIGSLDACAPTRTIEGVSNGQSIQCDAGDRILFSGVSIKSSVTGNCAAICVDGMNNQITVKGDALAVLLEGTTNTLSAYRIDAVTIDGLSNKVIYRTSAHKDGPKASVDGVSNSVSRTK
jgi:hypothetical protein